MSEATTEAFERECYRVFDDGQAEILVRAMLKELRRPSDAMLDAGGRSDDWSQGIVSDRHLREAALGVWRPMIDAALGDG